MPMLNMNRLNTTQLNNSLTALFTILFVMLTPLIVLLLCFATIPHNAELYKKEFIKTGVDADKAMSITNSLIDYFKNDYYGPAPITEFNEEENIHLRDVKILIKNLLGFLAFALLAGVVLFAAVKNKKKALFYSGILTVSIPALILAVLLIAPFEHLFSLFHTLFFPQGGWLFPAESLMVNLFTESFFYDIAIRLFLQSMAAGLILTIAFRCRANTNPPGNLS